MLLLTFVKSLQHSVSGKCDSERRNKRQFWVPPGLAHGFVVLSEIADFEYKCTDYYDPNSEGCLLWNDPSLGINWQIENPKPSEKDKNGKLFSELFS